MTVARVLFLARYRVPHACFAMQWDHNLLGIDYTIIASPVPQHELWPVFERYGIDTSRLKYMNDSVIYQRYPEVNNWVFDHDYRGWWLRQQAIKLAYRDLLEEDVILMHDCDTFMIEPYRCWDGEQLNYLVIPDTKHGSYHGVFESITGLPEASPHCFVTELVPVLRTHWLELRKLLAQRWPDKLWLNAIIDAVPGMPTIPPWGTGEIIKWFSEYELIGNWAAHCDPINYTFQKRFEYNQLELLSTLDAREFNAVCDAVPDLSQSMQLDWDTLDIPNFEHYQHLVKQCTQ